MPSAKTRSTVSRQWELLRQLPTRGPGITSAELVLKLQDEGFPVSKRTIERDLNELSTQFALQCNDKGMPYGWHWAPGASVELPGISLSEALSLALVEDAIRPLLPASMLSALEARFCYARKKLEGLASDNHAARWLDKVASVKPALTMQAPEVPENILETLQKALLEESQLKCQYYSAHFDKTSELILNPLALVQRGLVTYLIATAVPYTDVRQFAVHRFRHLEIVAKSSTQGLEAFNLLDYLGSDALQFGNSGSIELQAWISDNLERLIRETPLSTDMMLHKLENGYRLNATLSNSWQLHWWILSQGAALVVEKPVCLRDDIFDKLKNAMAGYAREVQKSQT
ncbi:MAG: helix-turn-helix transcriptional regulator [Pseudomonas sp.]